MSGGVRVTDMLALFAAASTSEEHEPVKIATFDC